MNVVFKYGIQIQDPPNLMDLPFGAKVLSAGMQADGMYIWVAIDPNEPRKARRTLAVIGTGNGAVPANARFISTVFDRMFVWHVFEIIG